MNKTLIVTVLLFSFLLCQCARSNDNEEPQTPEKEIPEEPNYPKGELIITEGDCFPDVADKYVYPFDYEGQMNVRACQLPDDALNSISTLGLIRSFIDVPYNIGFRYHGLSSSPWKNFQYLYSMFNSVQELLTRKDATESLIAYYAATTYDCYDSIVDAMEWLDFVYRLQALDYLFATLVESLNHDDRVKVVKLLLVKYKQKKNPYNLACIMVWMMYDDMIAYFDEESFEPTGYLESLADAFNFMKKGGTVPSLMDDILAFAEKFINSN